MARSTTSPNQRSLEDISDEMATLKLEQELQRDLHLTRWCGVHYLAEQVAADVTVDGQRPEEVGVIKRAERFHSKLKNPGLGKL